MKLRPVIGVCGRARTGKDTAAEAILRMGGGAYRYSFADPLRAMVRAGWGVDAGDPYWQRHKEASMAEFCGRSLRHVLQTLGTEWGREHIHPDVWVRRAADELATRGPGMVIADVRFGNEATWIRGVGGLLIHLTRPDAAAVRSHASERGVAREPDEPLIVNDGCIEELYEAVHDIIHGREW